MRTVYEHAVVLDEKTGDPLGFGGEEAVIGSCASRDARRLGTETGRVAGIVKSRGRDIFLPGRCVVETLKKERGDD